MKIISGKLKGRAIKGFDLNGTRPTMDRVKESLFASIQDYIQNSICLDLFAGSGNLGIEAISMGASFAYLCDKNKKACSIIKENSTKLAIETETKVIQTDFKKALDYFYSEKIKFDIIFLDPPYQTDYIKEAITLIEKYDLLNKDGIIVCESDRKDRIIYGKYELIKSKKYGDKYIEILKYL